MADDWQGDGEKRFRPRRKARGQVGEVEAAEDALVERQEGSWELQDGDESQVETFEDLLALSPAEEAQIKATQSDLYNLLRDGEELEVLARDLMSDADGNTSETDALHSFLTEAFKSSHLSENQLAEIALDSSFAADVGEERAETIRYSAKEVWQTMQDARIALQVQKDIRDQRFKLSQVALRPQVVEMPDGRLTTQQDQKAMNRELMLAADPQLSVVINRMPVPDAAVEYLQMVQDPDTMAAELDRNREAIMKAYGRLIMDEEWEELKGSCVAWFFTKYQQLVCQHAGRTGQIPNVVEARQVEELTLQQQLSDSLSPSHASAPIVAEHADQILHSCTHWTPAARVQYLQRLVQVVQAAQASSGQDAEDAARSWADLGLSGQRQHILKRQNLAPSKQLELGQP